VKLSDLKPCACCNRPLCKPPLSSWYVIRISQAMVNPRAANEVLGLTQVLQGALAIAEAFAPDAGNAVTILGDKEPALMREIHICLDCLHETLGRLANLYNNREGS
jgi:hypothetical protein